MLAFCYLEDMLKGGPKKLSELLRNGPHVYCWSTEINQLQSHVEALLKLGSRSGRINQSQCSIPSIVIGWFFRFCL